LLPTKPQPPRPNVNDQLSPGGGNVDHAAVAKNSSPEPTHPTGQRANLGPGKDAAMKEDRRPPRSEVNETAGNPHSKNSLLPPDHHKVPLPNPAEFRNHQPAGPASQTRQSEGLSKKDVPHQSNTPTPVPQHQHLLSVTNSHPENQIADPNRHQLANVLPRSDHANPNVVNVLQLNTKSHFKNAGLTSSNDADDKLPVPTDLHAGSHSNAHNVANGNNQAGGTGHADHILPAPIRTSSNDGVAKKQSLVSTDPQFQSHHNALVASGEGRQDEGKSHADPVLPKTNPTSSHLNPPCKHVQTDGQTKGEEKYDGPPPQNHQRQPRETDIAGHSNRPIQTSAAFHQCSPPSQLTPAVKPIVGEVKNNIGSDNGVTKMDKEIRAAVVEGKPATQHTAPRVSEPSNAPLRQGPSNDGVYDKRLNNEASHIEPPIRDLTANRHNAKVAPNQYVLSERLPGLLVTGTGGDRYSPQIHGN